jgi:nitrous oxidase accessory protein NosD
MAAYSLPCAVLYRLAQISLWALELALLHAAPGWTRAAVFLETAHLRWLRRLFRALPERVLALLPEQPLPQGGERVLCAGGEIGEDVDWSGEVRAYGDVVVLPGATLTIRPGTRITFCPGKRFHHGARRSWDGKIHDLADPGSSQLVVYGRLRALGEAGRPVSFTGPGGILLLGQGGRPSLLRHAALRGSLRCMDRARVMAEGVRFAGASSGIFCRADARAGLRACSFEDCGAVLDERAAAAFSGCRMEDGRGVSAGGKSRVKLRLCELRGKGGTGLRLEGRAFGEVAGGCFKGFSEGISLREAARAEASDCVFEDNGLGIGLADSSRATLRRTRMRGNSGHGLWLRDRAFARMQDGSASGSSDNGISLTGSARAVIGGVELAANRRGLSCEGASAARARGSRFIENSEANASLAGGTHRFDRCELERGSAGLRISGGARVRLARCAFRGHAGEGLSAAGCSTAEASDCVFEDNGLGIGLADSSRGAIRLVSIRGNRGHGLSLTGRAFAVLEGGTIGRSCGNGVYLTGNARVCLKGPELSENRCGLTSAGSASVRVSGASFSGNLETGVSLEGGAHRFKDVRVEGSPLGAALGAGVRAAFVRGRVAGNGVGVRLTADAKAAFRDVRWSGNRTGLWPQERSFCRLKGGAFGRHEEHGVRLGQEAALDASGARLSRCFMGLFLEDRASASMDRCALRKCPTGVKADGEGLLSLRRSRVRGCALDGVWLGPRVRASLAADEFIECRIGVHRHEDARPSSIGSVFSRSGYADRMVFHG